MDSLDEHDYITTYNDTTKERIFEYYETLLKGMTVYLIFRRLVNESKIASILLIRWSFLKQLLTFLMYNVRNKPTTTY